MNTATKITDKEREAIAKAIGTEAVSVGDVMERTRLPRSRVARVMYAMRKDGVLRMDGMCRGARYVRA